MLILEANEICPYSQTCQYNNSHSCFGATSNRGVKFECEYVIDGKIIENQQPRLILDKTGKMRVIME